MSPRIQESVIRLVVRIEAKYPTLPMLSDEDGFYSSWPHLQKEKLFVLLVRFQDPDWPWAVIRMLSLQSPKLH